MNVQEVLPRDAIESIDDPVFGPDYFGDPEDTVVVVEGEPPRAYPVRVLSYHEVVNDVVPGLPGLDGATSSGDATGDRDPGRRESGSGHPVAVTWCPICASAVVYDRVVGGRTLTFGVSGKLADDALVLYDRETGSEWKQSSGECIAGEFAGRRLDVRPSAVTTRERFADRGVGVVLQPPGGESEAASDDDEPAPIDYGDDPYAEYRAGEGFGLDAHRGGEGRAWDRTLPPKAVVLGVECDGEAVGIPYERARAAGGVVTTTVGDTDVVAFATDDGIHAFEDPGVEFESTDDPARFAGDGTCWDGTTGRADDDRRLRRLPARRLFAFAWQDDHGPDAFWEV